MESQKSIGFEVACLPFAPTVIKKLLDCGFKMVEDFKGVKITELSKECNISNKEAMEVLEYLTGFNGKLLETSKTAIDLISMEINQPKIFTLSKALDSILGGGISLGSITEIIGPPGMGKTQIGIQLSVNVQQLKEKFNGLEGEAIYIDTEGSLVPERVEQVAQGFLADVMWTSSNNKNNNNKLNETMTSELPTIEKLLSKIYFYRIHNYIEQLAIVNILPNFLKEHRNIRLIVIDSIAFHFRTGFSSNMAARSRLLMTMAKQLSEIASNFQVAIVAMNQVTTRIEPNKTTHLVPALGDSWAHSCANRVFLSVNRDGRSRIARLIKSSSMRDQSCEFQITKNGIRDVITSSCNSSNGKDIIVGIGKRQVEEDANRKRKRLQLDEDIVTNQELERMDYSINSENIRQHKQGTSARGGDVLISVNNPLGNSGVGVIDTHVDDDELLENDR